MVASTSENAAEPIASSPGDRIKQWLLFDGNRFVIASMLATAFGIAYVALSVVGVAPISDGQPLFYAFSGLISGNLTLITVVVSINQLLLSRELKSPGELESEIEETVDYRREIEAATNRTAPAEPSGFLRLVVESARQDAQRLGGTVRDAVPEDVREEIDEIVTELTVEFDRIDEKVTQSDSGIFNALSTTLETNFADEIRRLESCRRACEQSPKTDAEIDDLLDRLREMDIARQYFKSVYLQVELSRLSRYLFYAGIPAIGTAIGALFVMTAPSGPPFGQSFRSVFFPLAVAVGLLPLAVLCSYILRTATVTERTAAITPFTTPEQER